MADNVNKQVRWFDHQFVRAADFQAEQDFATDRRRRHNSGFHTPGVVQGLEPSWADAAHTHVNFTPGWAVDASGNDMMLLAPGPGVAVAGDTAIWIQAQRTASDPSTDPGTAKPGGGGNEETRWDETPKIFAAPPSPAPNGAVRLATISGGALTDAREMAGLGGRDIVLSKDIKPADPGTDQDVTTGAGVKTGHIKDEAIVAPKLAPGSVTTPAIGTNQVTSDQLAHDGANDALRAVGTDHIKDGTVTPAKLQPGVPYPFSPGDGSVTSPTIHIADNSGSQDATTGVGVKTPHIQDGAVTLAKLDPHVQSALPKAWCRGQAAPPQLLNAYNIASFVGQPGGFGLSGQYTIQWDTTVLGFGERPFLVDAYDIIDPQQGLRAIVAFMTGWVRSGGGVNGILVQLSDIQGFTGGFQNAVVSAIFF